MLFSFFFSQFPVPFLPLFVFLFFPFSLFRFPSRFPDHGLVSEINLGAASGGTFLCPPFLSLVFFSLFFAVLCFSFFSLVAFLLGLGAHKMSREPKCVL